MFIARRFAVLGSVLLFPLLACAQFKLSNSQRQAEPAQQTQTPSAASGKQFNVAASGGWIDTGIVLKPGDKVSVTGAGSLQFQQAGVAGPEGLPRSWHDVMQALPLNSAGRGALIARVGSDPAVVPFLVGAKKQFVATQPGHLFLRVNLADDEALDGDYKANIQVTPAGKAPAVKAVEMKFHAGVLNQVPRRVTDADGGKGDMVNFVLIGSQQQVLDAFSKGGWVQVDRTKGEAVAHAILATIAKQSYLEMPMSELYLYGRPQDYGMARAEPISVVQTRHHLRLWKAPFQIGGRDVWAGAATHDLGFEKDQRNGNLTHRIDPNVDAERDFVRSSLSEGGGVAASTLVAPANPVTQANTATGGSFHSDGKIAVIEVKEVSK